MTDQSHDTGAVFLSYASQDSEAATRICEALRAAGVEVWLDKSELRGGDAWDAQIRKHIHDCALFIPVISAHTNARSEGYFRREWKQATRRLQDMADDVAFVVPVVIDESREADARVPEEFLHAQWTWLPGGETPPAFAQRVRQLLGLDPAPVSTAKVAAVGAIERGARSSSFVQPSGLPLVRRFALPLIVLLLVTGGGAFWYYQGPSNAPVAKPAINAELPVVPVPPNDNSIAVLPFADMSAEKNQEYMSDGIAEELLNLLAQAPDLKVIARTSSFSFKGQKVDVSEIAKKLNVAHVLEGSVRTSGKKLRITAQLVRTSDSTHLWSQTYDRPMDDIFAVQDEIAIAIVQALQIRLAGGEVLRRKGGTQNLEAYQLYLRAWNAPWNSRASLELAAKQLEQAIGLDPRYGTAWSALSSVVGLQTENGFVGATAGWERVRALAKHALQLSPDLAHAHSRLQWVHTMYDWDWKAAEAESRLALALGPNNPNILNMAGVLSRTLGRWELAERQFRTALDLDPLEPYVNYNLGVTYYLAGRLSESEHAFRKLLELAPDFPWTRGYLARTLLARGKPAEALTMVLQGTSEDDRLVWLPMVLYAAGRRAEADEALKVMISKFGDTSAFFVAQTYAHRGDDDLALDWLERAVKQKDPGLVEIVGEPLFSGLVDDPRYKSVLHQMNLPEA